MNYERLNINLNSSHTVNLANNKRATLFVFNGFKSLQSGFKYPQISISGKNVKSVGPGDTADVYMLNSGNSIHICTLLFSETSINVNVISNGNGILNVTVSETSEIDIDGTHTPTTDINWNNHKITNLHDPTSNQDAATKHYADNNLGGPINYTETDPLSIHKNNSNGPITDISWGNHRITNLQDPTNPQDIVTLKYFNDHLP